MALLTIGTLLPAVVFGEDPEGAVDGAALPAGSEQTVDLSLASYRYETPWYLAPELDAITFPDDQPFAEVEFQDGSTLGRLSRLRSLSLLTFAEIGDGRLFFGVNNEGFLGLHFNAISEDRDQREYELVRMPYLEEHQAAVEDQ